jgi:hypothetical protein
MSLKVFTCTDHKGHWPVGVASVVVADSETGARQLLDRELRLHGLAPSDYTLQEISTELPRAFVLTDGDY